MHCAGLLWVVHAVGWVGPPAASATRLHAHERQPLAHGLAPAALRLATPHVACQPCQHPQPRDARSWRQAQPSFRPSAEGTAALTDAPPCWQPWSLRQALWLRLAGTNAQGARGSPARPACALRPCTQSTPACIAARPGRQAGRGGSGTTGCCCLRLDLKAWADCNAHTRRPGPALRACLRTHTHTHRHRHTHTYTHADMKSGLIHTGHVRTVCEYVFPRCVHVCACSCLLTCIPVCPFLHLFAGPVCRCNHAQRLAYQRR